jgi:hypothetical protein
MAHALSAAIFVLLAACTDTGPTVTGPPAPATGEQQLSTGNTDATEIQDPLSSRLSSEPGACLVAVRSTDGRYFSRATAMPLPRKIASSAAATTRFAYRGWAPFVSEPVILAVCTIPDTREARDYFQKQFGSKPVAGAALKKFAQSAGVAGVEDWGAEPSPHVMQGAGSVYMTDGRSSDFRAIRASRTDGAGTGDVGINLIMPCDPTAIIPEPGCDGAVPEEEVVSETPPPPAGEAPYVAVPNPSYSTVAELWCEGWTEYPHLSTTPGYYGRINQKSHNWCVVPLPNYVITYLKRESCFLWVFCAWPTIASAVNMSPSSRTLTAIANTECRWKTGWYRGEGYHQATFPTGVGSARSSSYYSRYIRCWW